jgi:hypothetical protein
MFLKGALKKHATASM